VPRTFDAVFEEAGTDEVVDGVVVRRRVAFDEARDARPWSRKMSATSRAGRSMGDRRQGGGPSFGSVRRPCQPGCAQLRKPRT
jgi:hypothetical protein